LKSVFPFVLALGLAANNAQAQTQSLSPQQARAVSASLLADGRPVDALNIASALLQRDANDVTALVVASRAATALGDVSSAGRFARRAYWASSGGNASFVAARLAANAYAAEGKDSRAQLWLRLARQNAADDASAKAIATDYQALRRRNPWSSSFAFAITPTSNINNGTSHQEITYGGISGFRLSDDAQVLSGLTFFGSVNTRYRLHADARSAVTFDFDAYGRTYRLSNDSQDKVPDRKGSDFSDAAAGVGLTYRIILNDGWAPTQANLRFGKNWYGGEPFTNSVDFNLSQPINLSERDQLTFIASTQRRTYVDDETQVRTNRLRASWNRSLSNGDALGISLSFSEAASEDIRYDYDGRSIGLNYAFGEPIHIRRTGLRRQPGRASRGPRRRNHQSTVNGASDTGRILRVPTHRHLRCPSDQIQCDLLR